MRAEIDAFYLPHLEAGDMDGWEERVVGSDDDIVALRWPQLNAHGVARIARAVRDAGALLRAIPVQDIITAIDRAVDRMRADTAQWHALAHTIARVTGYSPAMSRYVLDRMAADWRTASLTSLVNAEMGDSAMLDGFGALPTGAVHAAGPRLCFHIFSGNVPGVAVTSIIRALLVKSPSFGKSASDEPVLAAAFARALADADPRFAQSLAITYWPGGTEDLEAAVFGVADAVVHYGGQASLADVRARIGTGTRMIDHGPRISFGMIARDALTDDTAADQLADDVACAVATFDQQGCVSPHVVYVEKGGGITPRDFAQKVSRALGRFAMSLPAGNMGAAGAAAVRRVRDRAEFRAIAGQDVEIFGSVDLTHTVIWDTTAAFNASCLHRTLTVHPVDSLEAALPLIAPFSTVLQSVAIAAPPQRTGALAPLLVNAGVTRITSFRDLPWPPPQWHHDGRGPLRELVRFSDLESPVP